MNRTLNLLAASTLSLALLPLGAAASQAVAMTTPPAPTPGFNDLATPAPKTSGLKITGHSRQWTRDSFTVKFAANTSHALLQVSQAEPTAGPGGRLKMAGAQPIVLTPAAISGGGFSNAPAAPRNYTKSITGLVQGGTYYYLITLPTAPGFSPVQAWGEVRTTMNTAHQVSSGHSWIDLTFRSDKPGAAVSLSTSPTGVGPKLGSSKVFWLKGTQIQGGHAPVYQYTKRFDNLTPETSYYIKTSVQQGQGYDYETVSATTKKRRVTVTVEQIHVDSDADAGIRGKGEILFQVRGTNSPAKSGAWGGTYGETSIGSDTTINLIGSGKAPSHTYTTTHADTWVQLEGREADWVTKSDRKFCESVYSQPGQNHPARWLNIGDSGATCYQFSYADAKIALPTGYHAGTAVQYLDVKVQRSPDLRFSAKVKVTVTSAN